MAKIPKPCWFNRYLWWFCETPMIWDPTLYSPSLLLVMNRAIQSLRRCLKYFLGQITDPRGPQHTIPPQTKIIHIANLIRLYANSIVFMRCKLTVCELEHPPSLSSVNQRTKLPEGDPFTPQLMRIESPSEKKPEI